MEKRRMRPGSRIARTVRSVALAIVAALVLAACGNGDDGVDTEFLTLATGSTGGTYFPLGGAMAGVWNDNLDTVRVNTQSSGASVENLRLLEAGEVELIMAVNGVAAAGIDGEGAFAEDGALENVAFVGNIYGEVMQIVARADSGITTIADMAGQRIAIGPPGSGTEVLARTILETEGIDPDNDIQAFQDTFGDATEGMRDGRIDAAFAILALPHGGTIDLANSVDLTLVTIEGSLLDTLLANDPTLSPLEVSADIYPNLTGGATFVTNWATLYTRPELSEDTVYNLTKVLYEQNESIANAHAAGNQIQITTATDGRAEVPMHPGAERYYNEVGAL
jgi:uncharacterized protein